ncbi:MAG: DNA polymerase/3'-5' exonuclease PolX [Candidatus Omnitrophica bacterium]|nr:DNA polymerase/3'-5' exonuclease PolX [Candidatus Omnitrophota bacterium]
MKNLEIAQIFRDIAKILEIKGDNPFRIRAYEKAAQNIESLNQDIEEILKRNSLQDIPGIGKDLEEKIKEIVSTGTLKTYLDLKKSVPEGLLELLNIPSVGPKTAKLLYEKLKIKNIEDLQKAIEQNKLKGIFGIREKTIANIQKGIEILKRGKERIPLAQALQIAQSFIHPIKQLPEVKMVSYAGSLRRQKETVRDIDILVISDRPQRVMDTFTGLSIVKEVLAKGETKAAVRTHEDVQVDCRVVEERSFGAALMYFTGSKNFNIKLRKLAIQKGFKINEYGVFKNEKFIAGRTEEEIFKLLNMDYIPPELREDAGEVELALKFSLPLLVEPTQIRGDLHVHSKWSDGGNSIEEIASFCMKKNYSYVAVTDHSQTLKVASGLGTKELQAKKQEIERLNKKFKNFRIFYGTEVDIDSEGNLDYKDAILKEFDIVIAAIHTGFKQTKEKLTNRIIRACENKYVHIIAHPTGRLWGVREPYEIDFEKVLRICRDTNTALEINAFPHRLDLNATYVRAAKEAGVRLAIGTDAHSLEQLDNLYLGVAIARRGWLEKKDLLNILDIEGLLKIIKK